MKKYLKYILFFLFVACDDNTLNLFGPSHHGDSMGPSHPEPIGISEIIDATSYVQWQYYKITQDSLVYLQDFFGNFDNNPVWDIAFQRNHIKTNSGTSGIGNVGAYVDSIETWNGTVFNNLVDIEDDFEYSTDTIINTFYDTYTHNFSSGSSNASLETWGKIDTTNNYTMTISNNKFIIRTTNEQSFYKFWVRDYYNSNNESGHVSVVFNLVCSGENCE